MSRSRKKHNISGTATVSSERLDKKVWHKIFRLKNKTVLKKADVENEGAVFVDKKEVSDPWQMSKDGKRFNLLESDRRK